MMETKWAEVLAIAIVIVLSYCLFAHIVNGPSLRSNITKVHYLYKRSTRMHKHLPDNDSYFEARFKVPRVCSRILENTNAPWSFITTQKTARYNCSHFMTIGDSISGRLGNTLFQVAAMIGTAHKHGYTPVLRSDHLLFKYFSMMDINENNVRLSNIQDKREIDACKYSDHLEHLSHSKNWTLTGYLQSWKYFSGAEEKLRYAFRFKKEYTEKVTKFLETIKSDGALNIGIHVRRSDFASQYLLDLGYAVAPLSYFNVSTEYFRRKYENVQFIVASDDIQWCRKYLSNIKNIFFSPFKEPGLDAALLSSCDHVIITAGSFGWWAAWLSGGTVIYYEGFPKPGSWLDRQFNFTEYYPIGWIAMQ